MDEEVRVVSYERTVAAAPARIFELIADPAKQPLWDGNQNLGSADEGQRVRAVGDVFMMTNRGDRLRANHVVEFEEGRRIAWMPSLPDGEPFGQLWRWEVEEAPEGALVRHSYDWTDLSEVTEPERAKRARSTTAESLRASVDRLAALAEQ